MNADLAAIGAVYEKRFSDFLRVATAIVGDRERARDAVQEAFAGAVRSRRTYRGRGSLEGWLWKAVVNSARKERLVDQPALWNETQERPRSENSHGGNERLRSAVLLLSERQRLVLFLRYYADLEYGAIAEALDVSPGTVAATLSAARANLRRLLQEVSQ